MMEIVHQRRAHHACGAARIERHQAGEIQRAEHDLEEVLAIVVAGGHACADAAVDVAGDGPARPQ